MPGSCSSKRRRSHDRVDTVERHERPAERDREGRDRRSIVARFVVIGTDVEHTNPSRIEAHPVREPFGVVDGIDDDDVGQVARHRLQHA